MVTKFQKRLFFVLKKVSYLVKLMPKLSIGKKKQELPWDEPAHYSKFTIIFDTCLTWLIKGMIYRTPQRWYFFPEDEFHGPSSMVILIDRYGSHQCYWETRYQRFQQILELADVSEKINEVRYYTYPLYSWQLSKYFLYHAFIVFKTENWWWSIERDGRGVTIQRSTQLETVRDQCQRRNRLLGGTSRIDLVKKVPDPINITVNELINRLFKEDRMNLDYKEKNGKHFANFIYNKIFSP